MNKKKERLLELEELEYMNVNAIRNIVGTFADEEIKTRSLRLGIGRYLNNICRKVDQNGDSPRWTHVQGESKLIKDADPSDPNEFMLEGVPIDLAKAFVCLLAYCHSEDIDIMNAIRYVLEKEVERSSLESRGDL